VVVVVVTLGEYVVGVGTGLVVLVEVCHVLSEEVGTVVEVEVVTEVEVGAVLVELRVVMVVGLVMGKEVLTRQL